MDGRIRTLTSRGKGTIVGVDGRIYEFSQEGILFWTHYECLRVVTRVQFDREGTNAAINVEIDET